ncbi:MAG: hypothetical protein ACYCXQ_02690 [Candidatus Humimicrobiaceae bacterium]
MIDNENFIKKINNIGSYNLKNIDYIINSGMFKKNDNFKDAYKEYIEGRKLELSDSLKSFEINKYIFGDPAIYCLNRFADAEIDFYTRGIRGLGRMSTYYPRFGGYFSKYLIKLPHEEINIIRQTIYEVLEYGYILLVESEIFSVNGINEPKIFTRDKLLEKWLPPIYVTDLSSYPTMAEKGNDPILYFCIKLNEITAFPKKFINLKTILREKLYLILAKYVVAGFLLRLSEVSS